MHIHIIGDLHGFYQPYEKLLIDAAIVDADLNWCAGTDQLWLIGDIFDRGNQAAKCLDLSIKLQQQAKAAGGKVQCLLGNHELMFLAARKFMNHPKHDFYQQWLQWGGHANEMESITDSHIEWLNQLPVMALVEDRLLIHSDNLCYVNHGINISQVNAYFSELLNSDDIARWEDTLYSFSARGSFKLNISGPKQAALMLKMYGGDTLIHGHTPISHALKVEPETITGAHHYANNLCCNVDGGIYLGGSGFVYSFPISSS